MSKNDDDMEETMIFHMQLTIPKRDVIAWKRFAAAYTNYSEAFCSLPEIRMNREPASMIVRKT